MKKIIFVLIISILIATIGAQEKVVLTTLNWEPYIGENLKNQGWVAEVVKEAFVRAGYQVEFKFVPWNRAVNLAKQGKVNGYFPEYYAENVKEHSIFSEPFPGGPLGFFIRKNSNIVYNNLEDLRPYTIGTVRGYVNTEEFDNAAYLKKEPVKDDMTNFKKLLGGRIDLVVADKFVGLNLLEKNMPDKKSEVEFITPALETKDLYVCFSKKRDDSKQILEKFNAALIEIKDDGTMKKILKSHGF